MENYEEMLKKETVKNDPIYMTYVKRGGMAIAFVAALGMASDVYSMRKSARQAVDDMVFGEKLTTKAYQITAYNVLACIGLGIMAYGDSRLKKLKQEQNLELLSDTFEDEEVDLGASLEVELDEKDMDKQ